MRRKHSLWLVAAGLGIAALAVERHRSYSLKGKVVLITGGSRGLGLCLARECAKRGASLLLVARNGEELSRAAAELSQMGAAVDTFVGDIREESAAGEAIAKAVTTFGRLDVLINNAGIISVAPLANVTETDFREAMATHFWAPLRFMNAALPFLEATRGRIVNISSIGGLVAVPHLAAYSASKFALAGLSDAYRSELAAKGIRVTSVFPGLLRTGSHIQAKFKGEQESEFGWFALSSATPLTSMNAERAARRIANACERGEPRLVLSVQAKLLCLATALLPNLSARITAVICKLLPQATPDSSSVKGGEVHGEFPLTWLTSLADEASQKNNEVKPV